MDLFDVVTNGYFMLLQGCSRWTLAKKVFLLDFADVLQFQAYALPRQQVYFVLTEVMEFGWYSSSSPA